MTYTPIPRNLNMQGTEEFGLAVTEVAEDGTLLLRAGVVSGPNALLELGEALCHLRDNNIDHRFALLYNGSRIDIALADQPQNVSRRIREANGRQRVASITPEMVKRMVTYDNEVLRPAEAHINAIIAQSPYALGDFTARVRGDTDIEKNTEIEMRQRIIVGMEWLRANPEENIRSEESQQRLLQHVEEVFSVTTKDRYHFTPEDTGKLIADITTAQEVGWEEFAKSYRPAPRADRIVFR